MNIKVLFVIAALGALLVESTLIAYPFVFIIALFAVFLFKSTRMNIIFFVIALTIDALRVVPIGTTALFVISFSILASFYNRTIHAADVFFFSVVILGVTAFYTFVAHYTFSFFWSFVTFSIVWTMLYSTYRRRGVLTDRALG